MRSGNRDTLHLVLPAYLQVTSTSLESADPPLFRASFGPHAMFSQELTLTGPQYFALSLCDGTRTTAEVLSAVALEFEPEEAGDLRPWLDTLINEGLLTFAEERPEVRPFQKERYARHDLFYASVGQDARAARAALEKASVCIVGVGGIGTWVGYLLAAAGIGKLRLIDGDDIEESNLTRQVLFGPQDLGQKKAEVAGERLVAQRADLVCETYPHAVEQEEQLETVIGRPDFIVLCANSPANIHDWVDRYAIRHGIAWLRAGYAHASALCGPLLVPGHTGCTACVTAGVHQAHLAKLPFVSEINERFQVPSFGPINGMAASVAAKEVIAWITGMGGRPGTLGSLMLFDALTLETENIPFARNPDCARCSHLFAVRETA